MTSVKWSPESIRDVESIRAFIAQDSPAYAELVARRVVAAVERLKFFPESGRIVPERQDPQIREIIVVPYRIVYPDALESWKSRLSSGVLGIFQTPSE